MTHPEKAAEFLAVAVKQLPYASPPVLNHIDQQQTLSKFVGLAARAAAMALDSGKEASEAVQLLDAGRGVLVGRTIDFRYDIKGLDSGLAKKYQRIREILDAPVQPASRSPIDRDFDVHKDRHLATTEFESLKKQIREQEGFGTFGQSLSPQNMMDQAQQGPIIVLNIDDHRCDAFIISTSSIVCEKLSKVTFDETLKQTVKFRNAMKMLTGM